MHFDDYMAIDIHGLQHKTLSPGKVFDTPKLQEDETNGKKEDESSEEGDQEN